ncbi:hypothetical protein GAMM_260003 [Gammaproteobacteria bacterium]
MGMSANFQARICFIDPLLILSALGIRPDSSSLRIELFALVV